MRKQAESESNWTFLPFPMPRWVKSDPHAFASGRVGEMRGCRSLQRVSKPGRQTAFTRPLSRGLVDSAELLAATKATGHLVFDPCCLCGDKLLACLYRTTSMILFQSREFDHRLVKALSKFCINSTSRYPEHPALPRSLKSWMVDIQ